MANRMNMALERLMTLASADLQEEWRTRLRSAAPDVPTSLLRRALAHHIQEQAGGGLPVGIARSLYARTDNSSTRIELPARLKPGTRLLREWNGRMHTVLVSDDGLLFEGNGRDIGAE